LTGTPKKEKPKTAEAEEETPKVEEETREKRLATTKKEKIKPVDEESKVEEETKEKRTIKKEKTKTADVSYRGEECCIMVFKIKRGLVFFINMSG